MCELELEIYLYSCGEFRGLNFIAECYTVSIFLHYSNVWFRAWQKKKKRHIFFEYFLALSYCDPYIHSGSSRAKWKSKNSRAGEKTQENPRDRVQCAGAFAAKTLADLRGGLERYFQNTIYHFLFCFLSADARALRRRRITRLFLSSLYLSLNILLTTSLWIIMQFFSAAFTCNRYIRELIARAGFISN